MIQSDTDDPQSTDHPGELPIELLDHPRERPTRQVQQPPTFLHRFPIITARLEFFRVGDIPFGIVVDAIGDEGSEFGL